MGAWDPEGKDEGVDWPSARRRGGPEGFAPSIRSSRMLLRSYVSALFYARHMRAMKEWLTHHAGSATLFLEFRKRYRGRGVSSDCES